MCMFRPIVWIHQKWHLWSSLSAEEMTYGSGCICHVGNHSYQVRTFFGLPHLGTPLSDLFWVVWQPHNTTLCNPLSNGRGNDGTHNIGQCFYFRWRSYFLVHRTKSLSRMCIMSCLALMSSAYLGGEKSRRPFPRSFKRPPLERTSVLPRSRQSNRSLFLLDSEKLEFWWLWLYCSILVTFSSSSTSIIPWVLAKTSAMTLGRQFYISIKKIWIWWESLLESEKGDRIIAIWDLDYCLAKLFDICP